MDSLIAGLPSNVAVLAHIVCSDAADVGSRWRQLAPVVEQLLRFSTLPLLAEYLRGSEIEAGLSKSLRCLQKPTFDTLLQLAHFTMHQHDHFRSSLVADYHEAFRSACLKIWSRKVAVRSDSGTRRRAERTLLEALRDHRNTWSHHGRRADPGVELQQQHLDVYLPMIDEILTAFAFMSDPAVCRFQSAGAGVVVDHHGVLGGVAPSAGEALRPDIAAVFRTRGVEVALGALVAVAANGATRRLAPINDFWLEGRESRVVIEYEMTGGKSLVGDESTTPFRDQLRAKGFLFKSALRNVPIWTFADRLRRNSRAELENLQGDASEYAIFVPRNDLQGPLQAFIADDVTPGSCLVLTGVAGSGKTAVLMELAQSLLDAPQQHAVLFVLGGGLDVGGRGRNGPIVDCLLRSGLIRDDQFSGFGSLLEHFEVRPRDNSVGRKLVLIVDAIDESPLGPGVMREIVEMALAAKAFPWVRIVASVREEMLERLELLLRRNDAAFLAAPPGSTFCHERLPVWVVPDLRPDERERIYERYRAAKLENPDRQACRTAWTALPEQVRLRLLVRPQEIRAWMTAFDGRDAPADVLAPYQLFKALLAKLRSKAPHAPRTLQRLASFIIETGRYPLGDGDARDERLDDGVVDKAVLLGVLRKDTEAGGATRYSGRPERSVEVLVMEEVERRSLQPQAIARWREWPVTRVLVAAMELLVQTLIERGHYENAGRVLGAIDLQLAPQSSMLFQAGRVEAAIKLRESLDPHLDRWPQLQRENRYQLAIGYMRRDRMDDARDLHEGLLAHVGSVPTPQQIGAMIYTSLRLRHRARALLANGEIAIGRRQLRDAIRMGLRAWRLARGHALRGNALGHLAMARLEASGAVSAGASPSFMRPSSLRGWRGWWWRIRYWPRIRIANRSFELAARLNDRPGSPSQRDLRSNVHWRTMRARLLLLCGDTRGAIHAAEEAEGRLLEGLPDAKCQLDLHWLLAVAFWQAGRPDDLVTDRFDKAKHLAAETSDVAAWQGIQADAAEYERQRLEHGDRQATP